MLCVVDRRAAVTVFTELIAALRAENDVHFPFHSGKTNRTGGRLHTHMIGNNPFVI